MVLTGIAIRGMAVVATAVVGFPNSWIAQRDGQLVRMGTTRPRTSDPPGLSVASGAHHRAGRLQERAAARHSPHAYNQQVSSIINSVISTQ